MTRDERERHLFYEKAVEVFGERGAVFLMERLPPGGHSTLATKDDLADLEQRLRLEMKALEERLRAELHKGLRSQLVIFVAVMTLLNTGLFTAFRLTL